MRRSLFFCLFCFVLTGFQAQAQSRFSVGIQVSPKLCVGNNTSVMVGRTGIMPNNETDGHSSYAGSTDLQLNGAYRFRSRDFLLVGFGWFDIAQKFVPSRQLSINTPSRIDLENQYRHLRFLHFPIEYYRHLGAYKRLNFFGSVGIDFVSDLLRNKLVYRSDLFNKRGERIEDGRVEFKINHVNMETFNVLASCAVRAEYTVSKHFLLSGSLQMKQGFRPLITSATFFIIENTTSPQPYSSSSHETSINNGQCLLLNLGMEYRL